MNDNLSFAYYSTEGQVSPTIKAQIQASLSAIYDFVTGCFWSLPNRNYKLYVKGNNQNAFTQGSMKVYSEYSDPRGAVSFSPQTITWQQFNAAGQYGVEIFDFRPFIDTKAQFKIEIVEDFNDEVAP